MTKHTRTMPCEYCEGTGRCQFPDRLCPHCLGQGHTEHEVVPLTPNEAFIYFAATRYALPRQTFAGSIVIEELQKVLHRMPYADRKLLEKEVSDALFKHEVDPLTRVQWEALVETIRQTEGA